MKRLLIYIAVIYLVFFVASPSSAAGIDNRQNFSAEFFRTYNRNAATDSADAAAYNPAGVMLMDKGAYINLSAHFVDKEYINNVDGSDLSQDKPSVVPGLFAIYKQDRWAAYGTVTIPGGGGKGEYKNGNASTAIAGQKLINSTPYTSIKSQQLEGESYYLGYTLGGAYKINDTVSISLGTRYISAKSEFKASLTVQGPAPDLTSVGEYEKTADGWGGIFGLNITPDKDLNIGIRYETRTKLDFAHEVTSDTGAGLLAGQTVPITDGKKIRRDLPALLGLGLGYRMTPRIKLDMSLTHYFNENADWNGTENLVNDGFDIGAALEYAFSDKLKSSVGYYYTKKGIEPKDMLKESPELDGHIIGGGLGYEYIPGLEFNLGLGKAFLKSESYIDTSSGSAMNIEYTKNIIFMAFGVQYKFK